MNEYELTGVMLGTLEDKEGNTYIGVSIGNRQCILTAARAMLLFERLGDMLVELGVIDDADDEMEVPRCH
jgi:hypothetical protein